MADAALRTAVIVPVPEAASVDAWRERTCYDKPSAGVPAHITLVFPFVPAAEIDGVVITALQEVVAGVEAFGFALRETRRFPDALWLAPVPPEPFARLTDAILSRFPQHPPYGGVFDSVVPHLTVAEGDGPTLDAAQADVGPLLPIAAVAREAALLEEVEPGHWQVRARLPLR